MRSGDLLAERYLLKALLGSGGMGEVWQARDQRLGRPVAVKMITSGREGDPRSVVRLLREAENAAIINHPGITVVHDVSEHEGVPFVVMEFLDGRDLNRILRDDPEGLPLHEATSAIRQTAEALTAAHEQGVIHRDIKPHNLIRLPDGRIKVCDFGISRLAAATTGLTGGGVLGTPSYLSPEQYEGRKATALSDLYSLGCTFYALLTGRPPFTGETSSALMFQHLNVVPRPPGELRPDLPADLESLVLELLAKHPADRPSSAHEVVRRLAAGDADRLPEPADTSRVSDDERRQVLTVTNVDERFWPDRSRTADQAVPHDPGPGDRRRRERPNRRTVLVTALAAVAGVAIPSTVALREWWPEGTEGLKSLPSPGPVQSAIVGPSGTAEPRSTATPSETASSKKKESPSAKPSQKNPPPVKEGPATDAVLERTVEYAEATLYQAVFSPDSSLVAAGAGNGAVKLWDVKSGKSKGGFTGLNGSAACVAFAPDGRTVAACGGTTVLLWDIVKDDEIRTFSADDGGLLGTLSLSDSTLIAGSDRGTVWRWSTRTGKLLSKRGIGASTNIAMAVSPAGDLIAGTVSADRTRAVKIWDARGGGLRGELDLSANDEFVDSLAFSPDGGLLATGAGLGAVRLWDTRAFRPVGEPLSGHKDFVVSVAFSPDGSMLASSGSDRNICLWNVAGRSLIRKLDTRLEYLDTLSFSPDGRLLAAVSDRLVQFVKMV